MSSTYFDIKTYTSQQTFQNRLNHNCRKKNIDDRFKEYKNIIFKNDRSLLKNNGSKNESNAMTRTGISRKIANYRYKLNKAKKQSTKLKYIDYIKELEQLRDNTVNLNKTSKPKKKFIELTFSITDLSSRKDLLRNQDYLKDLNKMLGEYIKDKFPNMDIIAIAGHLDQSTPHIHINGMYIGDNNLNKDLGLNFGGKRHYKSLQRDFNKFIQEHDLVKKHNIKVNNLNDVSKDYLKLKDFKSMQARCKEQAHAMVENYVNKKMTEKVYLGMNFTDLTKVVEILKNKLAEFYYRDLINKQTPSLAGKVIDNRDKKIEELEYDNRVKDNDIRNLENNIIKLKDNLNKKIDKDALDKHVQQLVDNKLIDYKKEINNKNEKIQELKEDLHVSNKKLDEYKEVYNKYKDFENEVIEFFRENNLEAKFNQFRNKQLNDLDL